MIDPATDIAVLTLIGVLFVLAFFAAIWPMDRY
jgi:hypothetical protein